MAAGISTLSDSDFNRSGSGFSFTEKLAEIAKNENWVKGFNALKYGNDDERNEYSSMWEAISASAEEPGNELYRSIRNYVDNIGNVDTCGLDALANYANELKISTDELSLGFKFPNEIKKLIEIFSVNTAYLLNKGSDVTSETEALDNSILHYTTIEKIADAVGDREKYVKLSRDVFYNTLSKFINLRVGEIDAVESDISASDKIWTLNISRLTEQLWDDEVTSDSEIYVKKQQLGVDKSFTERIYADDIISGKRSLDEFTANEQEIIRAEMKARETRFGSDASFRYYYIRLYKVIEYFRFTSVTYRNVYTVDEYDLYANKSMVVDSVSDDSSIIKFSKGSHYIDDTIVMAVAGWLADYSAEIRNFRMQVKKTAQKNMMTGTKKVIIDTIREYLLEKIDGETWRNIRNTTLFAAGLNRDFDVSIVEYVDPTEYFNINNESLTLPNSEDVNERYWTGSYDDESTLDGSDVLDFYNKLTESRDTFLSNKKNDDDDATNLYEFLTGLFEMGATNSTIADASRTTTFYYPMGGSTVAPVAHKSGYSNEGPIIKYSGDAELGSTPYINEKNTRYSSYQVHPFLNAFEEYTEIYTGMMNLVNSFSANLYDSWKRLDKRIDTLGHTINFWLNWNEDFTGYSTWFEKGGDDCDPKLYQDSPFNFDALNEFLDGSDYINELSNRTNKYYINERTGLFMLGDDEVDREILRLKRFSEELRNIRGREIFKYGRDNYGNSYMLYKESGNRGNRDAVGDIWIRFKNHPIAFPLFDMENSNASFSDISCMESTDNSKLMDVLSNNTVRFSSGYGSDSKGSSVVFDGLVLTTASNTVSDILRSDDDGNRIELESPTDFSKYTADTPISSYTAVKPHVSLSVGDTYTYYIDTETDSTVVAGTVVYKCVEGDSSATTLTAQQKPFDVNVRNMATAVFGGGTMSIASVGGPFVFANFDSSYDNDHRTYFYYKDSSGVKHAVSQHTVKIKGVYGGEIHALSGTYDSDGNVVIGNLPIIRTCTDAVSSLDDLGVVQTIDGGAIYENFHTYNSYYEVDGGYGYEQSDVKRVNSILCGDSSDYGYITYVGGCNPVFVEQTYDYSEMEYPPWKAGGSYSVGDRVSHKNASGAMCDYTCIEANADSYFYRSKWQLVREHDVRDDSRIRISSTSAYMLKRRDDAPKTRSFSFSSDNFYRNDGNYTLYGNRFDIGSVEFVGTSPFDDTVRPFRNGDGSNVYHPYTSISKVVNSPLDQSIVGIDSPLQTITVNGVELYYKVLPDMNGTVAISGCDIDSNVIYSTLRSTITKFHGSVVLSESATDDNPVRLTFSDDANSWNHMSYSSAYSNSNQRKFNDFCFSYDNGLLMLEYSDGDGTYCNSGTIVGKITEDVSHGVCDSVSLLKNNIKNIEYVDSVKTLGSGFHIGDTYNKTAAYSVYGNVSEYGDVQYLGITVHTFVGDNEYTSTFRHTLKFKVHEFDDADRSRYSFNAVATDERLYVSFVCDTPEEDEEIGNTINGMTTGVVGTARFGNISQYCDDGLVTIFSFDITDCTTMYSMDDEIRYIMGNGALGYFPQYSGLKGKNVIFTNGQIADDIRYPFYAQFDEFEAEKGSEIVNVIKAVPSSSDGREYGRINIDRFIDAGTMVSDNGGDIIRGFVIEGDSNRRVFHVKLDTNALSGDYDVVEGIPRTYDISEPPKEDYGSDSANVRLIATANPGRSYSLAFVLQGDGSEYEKKAELVYSGISANLRTDFREFKTSDSELYALHSDGRTVSKLSIESVDGELIGSGAVRYDGSTPIVPNELSDGFVGETDRVDGECAFNVHRDATHKDEKGVLLYVDGSDWSEYTIENFPSDRSPVAVHVRTDSLVENNAEFYVKVDDLRGYSQSTACTSWSQNGTHSEFAPFGGDTEPSSWNGRDITENVLGNEQGDIKAVFRYTASQLFDYNGSTSYGYLGTAWQMNELLVTSYATISSDLEHFGITIPSYDDGREVWTSTQSNEHSSEGSNDAFTVAYNPSSEKRELLSVPLTSAAPTCIPLFSVTDEHGFYTSYHGNGGDWHVNNCTVSSDSYTSIFSTFVDIDGEPYPHTIAFGDGFAVVYRFSPHDDGNVAVKVIDGRAMERLGDGQILSMARVNGNRFAFTHDGDRSVLMMEITYGDDTEPNVECHWNDDMFSKLDDTYGNFSAKVSNGSVLNVFSVNCGGRGYVMYVDRNLTFSGSVAEFSAVYDSDGTTELELGSVGRCYSFGDVMAVSCDGNSFVVVSRDYGKTFVKQRLTEGMGVNIISAASDMLFALDANASTLMHSYDGEIWVHDGDYLPAEWRAVSNTTRSYVMCNKTCDYGFDRHHRVRILSQSSVGGEYGYDSFCVDGDGNVVLYGGLDGTSPVRIARSQYIGDDLAEGTSSNRTYGVSVYGTDTNGTYSSAYLFGGSMFFAPLYSTRVVKISNATVFDKETELSLIDVGDIIGNRSSFFRGFDVVNGSLVMYPYDGSKMLAYSEHTGGFISYYTSKTDMTVSDSDAIGESPDNELLLTPRSTDSDGSMSFVKTMFTGRNDYGIVELDNGFPILVTYSKLSGEDAEDWDGDVYQFTFTMMNDSMNRKVTVYTAPKGFPGGFDEFKRQYPELVCKSCSYAFGDSAMTYSFETVDDDTKYCIYRHTVVEAVEDTVADALTFTYTLNSSQRLSELVHYSTETSNCSGFVSVIGGFGDMDPSEESPLEDYPYIAALPNNHGVAGGSDAKILPFARYPMTDTATFSGAFDILRTLENNSCIDSNFNFTSVSTLLRSASGMFEGCVNASFSNALTISSVPYTIGSVSMNITSTNSMFKNCYAAQLPSVDVSKATDIVNCDSMFFGCANATLDGVTIPPLANSGTDMFHGCAKATLDSIDTIPSNMTQMSGMFNGCKQGTFSRFSFGNDAFEDYSPYLLYTNGLDFVEYDFGSYPHSGYGHCIAVHVYTPSLSSKYADFYVRTSDLTDKARRIECSWQNPPNGLLPRVTTSIDTGEPSAWEGETATRYMSGDSITIGGTSPASLSAFNEKFTYDNIEYSGYIGTALQMRELDGVMHDILTDLRYIQNTAFDSYYGTRFWTSTQSDATSALSWSNGSASATSKGTDCRILPLYNVELKHTVTKFFDGTLKAISEFEYEGGDTLDAYTVSADNNVDFIWLSS